MVGWRAEQILYLIPVRHTRAKFRILESPSGTGRPLLHTGVRGLRLSVPPLSGRLAEHYGAVTIGVKSPAGDGRHGPLLQT